MAAMASTRERGTAPRLQSGAAPGTAATGRPAAEPGQSRKAPAPRASSVTIAKFAPAPTSRKSQRPSGAATAIETGAAR